MKTKNTIIILFFLACCKIAWALDYTVVPTSKQMTVKVPVSYGFLATHNNYSVFFFIERGEEVICVGRQSAVGGGDTLHITVYGDDGVQAGMYEGETFKIIYYLGGGGLGEMGGCEIFINHQFQTPSQAVYQTGAVSVMTGFSYNTANLYLSKYEVCESTNAVLKASSSAPAYLGYQFSSKYGLVDIDNATGKITILPESVGVDSIRLTLKHTNRACYLQNAVRAFTVQADEQININEYVTEIKDQSCEGMGKVSLDFTDYPKTITSLIIDGTEILFTGGKHDFSAPHGEYEIGVRDVSGCVSSGNEKIEIAYIGNCDDDLILMPAFGGPTSIYFKENEQISIYDKKGALVHQFQGPGYWDGKSNSGQLINIGLYVVYFESGAIKKLKVYN